MKPRSFFTASFLLMLAFASVSAANGIRTASGSERDSRGELLWELRSLPLAVLTQRFIQQGAGRGPITPKRDPELEKQSLKSLEAARFYFNKRKPPKGDKEAMERTNKAIEDRLLEILDLDPTFSKVDEVYFLLGEVYARWERTDDAVKYLSLVVKEFPDSAFFKDAKKHLDELQAKKK